MPGYRRKLAAHKAAQRARDDYYREQTRKNVQAIEANARKVAEVALHARQVSAQAEAVRRRADEVHARAQAASAETERRRPKDKWWRHWWIAPIVASPAIAYAIFAWTVLP